MGTTATEPFYSSTFCAKRWELNLGPAVLADGAVKGYVLQMLAFGDEVPEFIVIAGAKGQGNQYRIRIARIAVGPVELDWTDATAFDDFTNTDPYLRLNLPPAKFKTDEDVALAVERFTGMVMHGKFGPHDNPQWKGKWQSFIAGAGLET